MAIGAERDQGMNKTEAEYAGMLEERKARREIAWWKYEAITFKLADDTRYTPDFAVMLPNGEFEIHETKGGFIREDGWREAQDRRRDVPVQVLPLPETGEEGWRQVVNQGGLNEQSDAEH